MTLLSEARAVLARHDQALAALARHAKAGGSVMRLGIPLELPTDLLSRPIAELAAASPDTRVQARHMSTAAQFEALRTGELDLALVREHPIGADFDATLVVEEQLGVLLAADQAAKIVGPGGIRLDALAAVSPGPTRTEGTAGMGGDLKSLASQAPAGRTGSPQEIADAIVFLASDRSSFVHGALLPVDGGRIAV
jgi:hypothetical protein